MGFNVRRIGGISTLFSGEGLVVDLTGPGYLMLQTRSEDAFPWLMPRVSKGQGGGGGGINLRLGGGD